MITWNEKYSVNVKKIDSQHKQLIAMLTELDQAMRKGRGRLVVGKILNGLTRYSVEHFDTEEMYFDRFNYPETLRHKKEHADFVQKVSKFREEFEQGKITLSIEVMDFLWNWLKNHILGSDKRYAKFFNDNGLF